MFSPEPKKKSVRNSVINSGKRDVHASARVSTQAEVRSVEYVTGTVCLEEGWWWGGSVQSDMPVQHVVCSFPVMECQSRVAAPSSETSPPTPAHPATSWEKGQRCLLLTPPTTTRLSMPVSQFIMKSSAPLIFRLDDSSVSLFF